LPGPLNAPLAATLAPNTPTERISESGRGVGVGVGVGDGEAGEGSGLAVGNSEQETVSATNDKASIRSAARPRERLCGTLDRSRMGRAKTAVRPRFLAATSVPRARI
jgi:hypothetical protein